MSGLEGASVMILFGREIAIAFKLIFAETSYIVLVFVPLVDAVTLLDPIYEIALIEGGRGIDLSSFALREVVDPIAFVE